DEGLARGIQQTRCDEHYKVSLDVLIGCRAKEPARKRDIAQDGNLVLGFLNVLTHQAANDHRLPVVNRHFGSHFSRGEYRLVDYVWRDQKRCAWYGHVYDSN